MTQPPANRVGQGVGRDPQGDVPSGTGPVPDPVPTTATPSYALRLLRFELTEETFPFFNRHPHHTTSETWAMWAERDVLALIDDCIEFWKEKGL